MKDTLAKIAITASIVTGGGLAIDVSVPVIDTVCDQRSERMVSVVDTLKTAKARDGILQYREIDDTERVAIKGCEISKDVPKFKVAREKVDIEIRDVSSTPYGVDILARAWKKDGTQIGFGADGSVEWERFQFHMEDNGINKGLSWLVVPDINGPIEVENTYTDHDGKIVTAIERYREDPQEHLFMFLENVINSLPTFDDKNIIAGKEGHTVTSFTSNTGGDGFVLRGPDAAWSTSRNAASGASANTTATEDWLFGDFATPEYRITAAFIPFLTSSLPDTDEISSATLTIRQVSNNGEGNRVVGLVQTTQAATTTLATSDFSQRGGLSGISEGATRVTMNTQDTTWTFTLNATGIGWISKTGDTKLGLRTGYDIDNTTPVARNYTRIAYADHATAAYRPTLSVTHAAPSASVVTPSTVLNFE